ncbi:snaclec agglucetin subunit beta-1-like [Saccostrea echinata]|uniref:snaclec agglucetin subunit beta-1-like n=1 Tax=Saccostrea echinata TaxID=191078 RepID=UPI002A82969F|nr:snaclec agglucetin subunit beta-1-like [Saccostrea echinata]
MTDTLIGICETGIGFILSSVLGSLVCVELYRVTNGRVGNFELYTEEQILKLSELDCSRGCVKSKKCLSIIFNSENNQCHLLSKGIFQNFSEPNLPPNLKVYTRRGLTCSDIEYQDLTISGTCFKVFSEKKSQHDANAECVKEGGHLIQLTSSAKHGIVHDFIKSMSSPGFFIDGSDAVMEDDWRLSDGNPLYLNWSPGEPHPCCKLTEDCVIMFTNGGYNDMGCGAKFSFICERQPLPVI